MGGEPPAVRRQPSFSELWCGASNAGTVFGSIPENQKMLTTRRSWDGQENFALRLIVWRSVVTGWSVKLEEKIDRTLLSVVAVADSVWPEEAHFARVEFVRVGEVENWARGKDRLMSSTMERSALLETFRGSDFIVKIKSPKRRQPRSATSARGLPMLPKTDQTPAPFDSTTASMVRDARAGNGFAPKILSARNT